MLTKEKIKSLLKSGDLLKSNDWMIRFDNDGISYNGFKWAPIGEWTIAPDWNNRPECGGGLHGQSPMAAGDCIGGSRMVLVETQGEKVSINRKIKVPKARIIAINEDIPAEFIIKLLNHGGTLKLNSYNHPLPANLASVGGDLDLRGYNHPLPANLASVGGDLYLRGYNHPLPANLASVGGDLYLRGYNHPLPANLASVGGYLDLRGYNHPLPANLASVGGYLDLEGYNHPLPAKLKKSKGIK